MSQDIEPKPLAYYQGRVFHEAQFMQHVESAQTMLSQQYDNATGEKTHPKVLNLCDDRYHFMVLFVASMLDGRVTVLPANQSDGEIARLQQLSPSMRTLNDSDVEEICHSQAATTTTLTLNDLHQQPEERTVAEVYTSGSTGQPQANVKTWGELVRGARRISDRFNLDNVEQYSVVATVPPQHMFGLEMGIMLTLVCRIAVHHGKPFFPVDVQSALYEVQGRRVLVTTPLHLKACATIDLGWPSVALVLSATATLSMEVAENANRVLHTPVREVYGCSEAGAIATRTLTENAKWELLDDFQLEVTDAQARLLSRFYQEPIILSDLIEIDDDGRFVLIGRSSDLIKIGGKRGSLAEITARFKSISGVEDAIVFMPPRQNARRPRLAALVVAPGLEVKALREQLRDNMDAVFVPRPIYLVPKLPYNSTGKLARTDLLAMLSNCQNTEKVC